MDTSGHRKPTIGLCRHTAELSQVDGEAAIKVSWYDDESWLENNSEPREVFNLVIRDMRWI